MKDELISMVQECVNEYRVKNISEDEVEISIKIPKALEDLWLVKLSDLHTTMNEIQEWKPS